VIKLVGQNDLYSIFDQTSSKILNFQFGVRVCIRPLLHHDSVYGSTANGSCAQTLTGAADPPKDKTKRQKTDFPNSRDSALVFYNYSLFYYVLVLIRW